MLLPITNGYHLWSNVGDAINFYIVTFLVFTIVIDKYNNFWQ